jgi:hypothetical protein
MWKEEPQGFSYIAFLFLSSDENKFSPGLQMQTFLDNKTFLVESGILIDCPACSSPFY